MKREIVNSTMRRKKTTKFDTHFHFHTKNEKKKNNILMDKTKRKGWYWNHAMLAAYYAN